LIAKESYGKDENDLNLFNIEENDDVHEKKFIIYSREMQKKILK